MHLGECEPECEPESEIEMSIILFGREAVTMYLQVPPGLSHEIDQLG
jgi:hypothetical protein